MTAQHLTWEEECEGIRKAWRNLKGDKQQFARYVYARCCAYYGPNHELWCERMIEAALEAVAQQWEEAATRTEEAVRTAGVEEDRTRAHVADLAEALAAVQAEEANPATAAMNRVKLEAAIGVCAAFREFVDGFQSRLEAVIVKDLLSPAKPPDESSPATPADLPGDM